MVLLGKTRYKILSLAFYTVSNCYQPEMDSGSRTGTLQMGVKPEAWTLLQNQLGPSGVAQGRCAFLPLPLVLKPGRLLESAGKDEKFLIPGSKHQRV